MDGKFLLGFAAAGYTDESICHSAQRRLTSNYFWWVWRDINFALIKRKIEIERDLCVWAGAGVSRVVFKWSEWRRIDENIIKSF